jgi:hypothetical protein
LNDSFEVAILNATISDVVLFNKTGGHAMNLRKICLSFSVGIVLMGLTLVGINPSSTIAQQSKVNYEKFCQDYSKQTKDFQKQYRGVYLKNCLKLDQSVAAPPKKGQSQAVPPIKQQSQAVPPASQPGQSAPPSQQVQDPKKDDKKAPDKQPDVTPVKRQPAPAPQPPVIKPAPDKEPEIKRPIPVLRPTLPDTRKGPLPVVKTHEDQKQAAADLAIAAFKTPTSAKPGEDIGKKINLSISNQGRGTATGSAGSRTKGYTVYLVLSRDQSVPVNVATKTGKFQEDLLLKGGGAVKTRDLASGEQFNFPTANVVIPKDTPAGSYNLCARLDPWNKVKESDERNNLACRPIRISTSLKVAISESDIPRPEIPQDRTRPVLPMQPGDRQLVDRELGTLSILNEIRPGIVRWSGRSTVVDIAWELPEDTDADGIYLLIDTDRDGVLLCVSGRAGGRGLPGSDNFSGARGVQTIPLNDRIAYRPGYYNIIGCLMREGAHTGDFTNYVDFFLEEDPSVRRARPVTSVELEPSLWGTEYVISTRESESIWCVGSVDRGGFRSERPDRYLHRESPWAYIGYENIYDPGTEPFPCWEYVGNSWLGKVKFDLSSIPADAEVRSATLRFRDGIPTSVDAEICPQVVYDVGSSIRSWAYGLNPIDRHRTRGHQGVIGRRTRDPHGWDFTNVWDVTSIVVGWREGLYENHGFALIGRDYGYQRNNNTCASVVDTISLDISYIAEP